jgi:hypothetical protein
MKRTLLIFVVALSACAPADPNPLIAATDDQFIKTMGNLGFLGCDRVLSPDKSPTPEPNREGCEEGIKKRAADSGITQVVRAADIADPRVRQRYQKLVRR